MKEKYQIQELETYDSHNVNYNNNIYPKNNSLNKVNKNSDPNTNYQEYPSNQKPQLQDNNNKTNKTNISADYQGNNTHIFDQFNYDNRGQNKKKGRYGNIKILYQNQKFLFTIGPDYICFTIAYILFTIMNFTIIYTAANQFQNVYVNIVNIVYSVVQNLSYLMVALSNPGIQTKNTIPTQQQNNQQIKRFCKKCDIRMVKGTHHCRDCDVCIRKYDHHCPWTSKCIGQKNLCKFYIFVTSTLTYLVYCLVLLLVCSAKNALQYEQSTKKIDSNMQKSY